MRLPARLLLVTDRRQARLPLAAVVAQACASGCRWISLREKDLPQDAQVTLARRLLPIARRHGTRLTVHGGAAVSRAAGVDGVHLAAGCDPTAARAVIGPEALLGISVHSVGEAQALDPGLVDYAVAGPAFATASKPGYGPALGAAGIAAIARASAVPVIAIGGIGPAAVGRMLRAGASGVAVMGSVMRADAPGGEVAALLRAFALTEAGAGESPPSATE